MLALRQPDCLEGWAQALPAAQQQADCQRQRSVKDNPPQPWLELLSTALASAPEPTSPSPYTNDKPIFHLMTSPLTKGMDQTHWYLEQPADGTPEPGAQVEQ